MAEVPSIVTETLTPRERGTVIMQPSHREIGGQWEGQSFSKAPNFNTSCLTRQLQQMMNENVIAHQKKKLWYVVFQTHQHPNDSEVAGNVSVNALKIKLTSTEMNPEWVQPYYAHLLIRHFLCTLTVAVCYTELRAHSLFKYIIRGNVTLKRNKMTTAPGCQQAHAAMNNSLHCVSVGC